MEFLKLIYFCFFNLGEHKFEEGFLIHFVRLHQVGIETIVKSVCKQAKFSLGCMKISKQLRVVRIQFLLVMFAFDQ